MRRRPDWPERLIDYIVARESRPFKWGKGEQDCSSFSAGGVLAMTDADIMADVPDYASAEDADLLLAKPLEQWLDERLPRRARASLAQRGDLALANLDGQDTVMIVEGATLVGPGRRGLVRLPRSAMHAAWAV